MVFSARDMRNGQTVALKVLLPEMSGSRETMQRVTRSLRTVQALHHPNLVTLLDAGETGPFCWMAMEFVDGESLTQILQRIGTAGILDWRHTLRIAVHIARALDFAAQHHIIHRNITPANILVRNSDRVAKLGDLMLAKALEDVSKEQITRRGELVGDLAYMAPERTYSAGRVDTRSDIYGLGATIYALLTGRAPCQGPSQLETIRYIREVEPSPPRKIQLSIPESFEQVVMKMLAKKPEERFQSPMELLQALEQVAREHKLNVT
jgi:serine/threonine-protein kinase